MKITPADCCKQTCPNSYEELRTKKSNRIRHITIIIEIYVQVADFFQQILSESPSKPSEEFFLNDTAELEDLKNQLAREKQLSKKLAKQIKANKAWLSKVTRKYEKIREKQKYAVFRLCAKTYAQMQNDKLLRYYKKYPHSRTEFKPYTLMKIPMYHLQI
ncbi:unnamed protein product [Moneuplotes crassus]|uniref:Uncharacterized protein n=1 Tax=Euplotes crassus TaxID=5936 RepID=A0AAD2D1N3_EUPCR|nr:unnamed protein product [Moneuplotes crassus]